MNAGYPKFLILSKGTWIFYKLLTLTRTPNSAGNDTFYDTLLYKLLMIIKLIISECYLYLV